MYIHLTTRCNMSCEHCCVSALKTGIDFTMKDFKSVLHNLIDPYDHIALGGGEPTLHKNFMEMLILAIAHCEDVFVATNGSHKTASLLMAKLARKGIMTAALSQDWAHDASLVDEEVVRAFTRDSTPKLYLGAYGGSDDDQREIRNGTKDISRTGRARELGHAAELSDHCVCETPQIYPDGRIKHCGCDDAPLIGNWKESFDIETTSGTCYRTPEDV